VASVQFPDFANRGHDVLKEIGPRLVATLLKNEGYDTPEALDAKVQSILTGDSLAEYLRVKVQ
jgi:hypothetical protein